MDNFPLIKAITYVDPGDLFGIFSKDTWSVLLDSADANQQHDDTNRYSYIGFDPFEKIMIKNKQRPNHKELINHPFQYLKQIMAKFKLDTKPNLPPFQGGAIGYFSYDLCHYLEKVDYPKLKEDTPYADLAIGIFDTIIAFDHVLEKAWIISTGFPEQDNHRRLKRAQHRLTLCANIIKKMHPTKPSKNLEQTTIELTSQFNKESYSSFVKKAQQYILDGDIFEVNLSHRFDGILNGDAETIYALYLKMRAANPSPFSAFLNMGDHQILSSSPERFLLHKQGHVSTRPIKGTAPRGITHDKDEYQHLMNDTDHKYNEY